MVHSIKSILIYTTGEIIGDGLIKIPFMTALKQAYPHTPITWWSDGPSVYSNVLSDVVKPYVDHVVGSYVDIRKRFQQFDIIVDTQKKFFNTLKLKFIPHKVFLSHSAKGLFSTHRSSDPLPRHDIHRLMALISLAGQQIKFKRQPLTLPQNLRAQAQQLLPNKDHCRYIGLVIGAGQLRKRWPRDNFIALAKWLMRQNLIPVFILGPQEIADYDYIKQQLPSALFPLQESDVSASPLLTIALGEQMHLAISNDCGGGHMMACATVPLISLFGPTNAEKVAPLVDYGIVIRAQDYGSNDITAIPVQAVIECVNKMLDQLRDQS